MAMVLPLSILPTPIGGEVAIPPIYPTSSLYVGDLHIDVNESILFEKFAQYGRILSVRVCRDTGTLRSLGYAYVNFQNAVDAERAMDALNFIVIHGRPIRIMWSQRDPALRRSGVGNIFIKNLDPTISTKDIYDTFSTFGTILSCKVAMNTEGMSKGFGFVHYETQESAKKAIEKVNGMLLCDKKLFVGQFISRQERVRALAQQPKTFTNVYVKNLPESYDDGKLKELFGTHGETTSCHIMLDKNGNSRCFGFVSFTQPECAENACKELNSTQIEGKSLFVGRAQKKSERVLRFQGVNLYIKNLDDDATDEDLRKDFQRFGVITSAKVMTMEDGRSRGFGFVCFTTPEEATRAIAAMNQKVRNGKLLYVAHAQRRQDRREILHLYFLKRGSEPAVNNSRSMGTQVGPVYNPNFYMPPTPPQHSGYFGNNQNQQQSMGRLAPPARWPSTRQDFNSGAGPLHATYYNRPPYRATSGLNMTRMPGHSQSSNGGNGPRFYSRTGGQQQTNNVFYPRGQMTNRTSAPFHLPMGGPISTRSATPSVSDGTSPPTASQTSSSVNLSPRPEDVPKTFRPVSAYHPPQPPLSPTALAAAHPSDQKQILGERIFPCVQERHPILAGKITGMLLEMSNTELLCLLENPEQLNERVDEAVASIRELKAAAGVLDAAKTQNSN